MNTLRSILNFLSNKAVLAFAIVSLVSVYAVSYRPVTAEEAPPESVEVSIRWMEKNVPTIKKLKAELDPLQAEKEKHLKSLEAFGYSVNWDTLEAIKLPEQPVFQ
jgi:hypothetical protein